ncbi:MAG: FixH family protein [Pseudomonadota bacterium]|nr:MAG: hypothetical protein DIU78_13935 [Pseudomonadota bacterium]
MTELAQPVRRARPNLWPFVPAILLTLVLAGLGTMAAIAIRDPGFALEPNYYQKALAYDGEIEQRAKNAELGWRVHVGDVRASGRVAELELELADAEGRPIPGATVELEAFAVARSGLRTTGRANEIAPGIYRARLEGARSGLWEVRVEATLGGTRFTERVRFEMGTAP